MSETQVVQRLQRIESRLVAGFNAMGVQVIDEEDWFKVNLAEKVVYLKGPGKTLAAVFLAMKAAGCRERETFDLFIGGLFAGTLVTPGSKL